jgi:high affinity Mn2+ porin
MWMLVALSVAPALRIGTAQTGATVDAPDPAEGKAGSSKAAAAKDTEQDDTLTMFLHSETAPWLVAGQTNIIFQAHPSFHSPYEGKNSFRGAGEYKTSLLGTLFLGYQLGRGVRGDTPSWSQRSSPILSQRADAA